MLWNIAFERMIDRDPNRVLIDMEAEYGLRNRVNEFPENRDRIAIHDGNASSELSSMYLSLGKTAVLQSVLSLGDPIRDMWVDPPVDQNEWSHGDNGWDIVLDKSRGITPETKVNVRSIKERGAYPVLNN